MEGALGQESTTKSFWKDLDQELEAIQAAKAAARTVSHHLKRIKSEKNDFLTNQLRYTGPSFNRNWNAEATKWNLQYASG